MEGYQWENVLDKDGFNISDWLHCLAPQGLPCWAKRPWGARSATSLGWGSQIRQRTPTCPTSWFCPLSQLGRIKRTRENSSLSLHSSSCK